MTTRWNIPSDLFSGETVAVLVAGPGMTQELADSVRQHKRIAVNDAYLLAPDADLLFAHDLSWWQANQPDVYGLKVSGQEGDIDAFYLPMPDETVTLAPSHILQVRNSGLMAIRIAAMAGAARIVLCGFQPEIDQDKYPGLAVGLAALVEELRAQGVEVETVTPQRRLKPGIDTTAYHGHVPPHPWPDGMGAN